MNLNTLDSSFPSLDITNISCDSGKITPGGLFVALKGTKVDGADFIAVAEKNGAIAVLADRSVKAAVPVIIVPNARLVMAQIADRLYPSDALEKVAVTGTNGKTSTVYYVAQLMNTLKIMAASMGTIGVNSPVLVKEGSMTTPDTVVIHQNLAELQNAGVRVVAMEASSHGLDQDRLAGIRFKASGFTNITQDHLDYHKDMASYFKAKKRLFLERMMPGGTVVLNADIPEFADMKQEISAAGFSVLSYGFQGKDLKIITINPLPHGQSVTLEIMGKRVTVDLNIVGDFQVMNILCALGLCLGLGAPVEKLIEALPSLRAPAGRLECVGTLENGASIYVDYAHTPDALERVLKTMRPHTHGRLVVVFGCGGDRDKGKRPLMGAIAEKYADVVYVTDDNPRTEDPAVIRSEIKAACAHAVEVDDRHEAVFEAITHLNAGDVLVLAGKGHEAGQTIQGVSYVFDDKVEAQLVLKGLTGIPLWTSDELKACLSAEIPAHIRAYGVSIDTRTLQIGDIFVAIRGNNTDGHKYVSLAVAKGAAVCLVDHLIENVPANKQIVVQDVIEAFFRMGHFARQRSEATFVAITGSSGKTTTKEMLKACLEKQGNTYATGGNFNGQVGVPYTLTNMPRDVQYAIIETGMDHLGELTKLSQMVQPKVTIITMIGTAHLAFFANEDEIALAKSEVFIGQEPDGTAILNADSRHYEFLRDKAVAHGVAHILSFGQNETADFKMVDVRYVDNRTFINALVFGEPVTYSIGFLGEHFARNSLAVLAAVDAVGASVKQAVADLSHTSALAGRGACEKVTLKNGKTYYLIDDSYNANPSSMRASLNTLGLHTEGPRIALLGDMLELGYNEVKLHTDLKQSLVDNKISKVYAVGALMKHLFDLLPPAMQGAWAATPEAIADVVLNELPEGAVLLVKSSRSMWLLRIIPQLKGEK